MDGSGHASQLASCLRSLRLKQTMSTAAHVRISKTAGRTPARTPSAAAKMHWPAEVAPLSWLVLRAPQLWQLQRVDVSETPL